MTVQHCHNNLEVSWAYTWNLRRPTPLSPNQLYAISRLCPDWFLESLDGKLDPKEVVGNADKSQSGHSGSSYQISERPLCHSQHNTQQSRRDQQSGWAEYQKSGMDEMNCNNENKWKEVFAPQVDSVLVWRDRWFILLPHVVVTVFYSSSFSKQSLDIRPNELYGDIS